MTEDKMTELQWRLKAVQRLVRVLLSDPNIMCGTNTKGEISFIRGSCIALSYPLGSHLALRAQEHEALSMLRMACTMHVPHWAVLGYVTPLHPIGPKDHSVNGNALLSPSKYCKVHHGPEYRNCSCALRIYRQFCTLHG